MSDFSDYAERVSERYSVLQGVGNSLTLEADAPLCAQRGPWYAARDLPRAQKALVDARKRAREEQIRKMLGERPYLDLLLSVPVGPQASVHEIVSSESRVVLLGAAGAGKSTALRSLATNRVSGRDGDLLTLVVDLPALAASGQSLPEYLASDAAQEMDLALSPDFFANVLATGQAVVCLDDLDSIPTQEGRVQMIGQIESWADQFPRSRYVVAARTNAYEPALDRDAFAHFVLAPWSETVVADLESAWAKASAEWTEEEAEGHLAVAPRLLADVLAAREVVALFDGGKLNAGWTEIRSHLWDASWRQRLALVFRFLSQERPETWAKVMSLLFEAGGNDAYGPALHRYALVAADALAASDVSDALDLETRQRVVDGLVEWIEDASAVGRQEAVGALFQVTDEPYVASRSLQLVQDAEADPWAREAAVLIVGITSLADQAAAVDALWARVDDGEEHARVRQAASTALGHLAAQAVVGEGLQSAVEQGLLAHAVDSELPIEVQVAATEALGVVALASEDQGVPEGLVALARGEGEEKPSFSVQMTAGRALNALLSKGSAPFVEQMWALVRDEDIDESVRTLLAETLGKLGDAQAAAGVLLAIAHHPKIRPPGRRDAMEALGRLGHSDEAVVEGLTTIAGTKERKTKDFERLAAARALGEIGHLDLSLQYLLTLIADKSIYRSTRKDALALLGQVGLTGDEDLDNASVAVLQVWATEWHTTEDVRERAMASLEMIGAGTDEVIRDLISIVQDRRSYPRVRRAAVAALDRLAAEQKDVVVESIAVPFFDQEDKNDLLRVSIARLLQLWGGNERALEYLRAAAEQSYQALVRYRAGAVLHELGETEVATDTMRKLATDSSIADTIRCDALRALSFWHTGSDELAAEILPILEEEDPMPSTREGTYAALKSLLTA